MVTLETFARQRWIVLLVLTNSVFYMVLNIAGISAGRFGIPPTGTGSIRLRSLYILSTHSPEFVPGSTDGNGGWTSYLYLNNACMGPEKPNSKTALGPRCQSPAFGQRYAVSTQPNLTLGYYDPQIICQQNSNSNTTESSGGGTWHLACSFDPETPWPRSFITLMPPSVLLLLAVFGSLSTLVLRLSFLRRCIPHVQLAAIIVSTSPAICYLIAASLVTSDARNLCNWVNSQHAEWVYDAGLGIGFFTMIWLMFVFSLLILTALLLIHRFAKMKQTN